MADNDTELGGDVDELSEEVAEPDFDHLAGILADGFIGAVGGLVGTAVMTVVLIGASSVGAFQMTAFATLADLTGLEAVFPANRLAVGYLLFLAGGMVTWPLLFASIGSYLPGETFALKGLPYGFVLWTGFVLAFAQGISGMGTTLVLYAVLTLVAHLAYGFSLGSVFDYLSDRPDTLV